MENPNLPTTTTLVKLAEAANVPVPLDLVLGVHHIPSPEILAGILTIYLRRVVPDVDWTIETLGPISAALYYTLLELIEDAAAAESLEVAEKIARAVLRQQLDQGQTPSSE
jgi:hypothetical protein